jgi:hypothetical protein
VAEDIINDVADTEDSEESKGNGGKGKAARILARALWMANWSVSNPESTPEERKEAWKAASEERVERVTQARRVLRIMAKRGVTFSVAPGAREED